MDEGNRIERAGLVLRNFSSALVALETTPLEKGKTKAEHSPTLFAPLGAILKTGAGSGVGENNGRTRWRRSRYLEMANRECAPSRRLGKLANKEHKFFTVAEDRFTGGRFADIWRPKFQSCRPLFLRRCNENDAKNYHILRFTFLNKMCVTWSS